LAAGEDKNKHISAISARQSADDWDRYALAIRQGRRHIGFTLDDAVDAIAAHRAGVICCSALWGPSWRGFGEADDSHLAAAWACVMAVLARGR
jgi:hypothetical protein